MIFFILFLRIINLIELFADILFKIRKEKHNKATGGPETALDF